MKKITLGILAVIGLVVAGCIVPSVYPFYTGKDLTTDDHLLGSWVGTNQSADDKEVWIFTKGSKQDYKFQMIEENATNTYSTHLFKLHGQLLMDCQFVPEDEAFPSIPAHYLAKIEQLQPGLKLATLNIEWLTDYAKKNPVRLRHTMVQDDPADTNTLHVVLTGDTAELQSFVTQYLSDTNAWVPMNDLKRKETK